MDPKGNVPADPRSHRGDTEAIATAVAQFLMKTGLFDREAYVARYPDVAKSGLDPLHHYMRYGIQAGFNCTSLGTIARLWREVLLEKPATLSTPALDNPGRYKAAVYVSSLGNFFMTEIADVIVCGLREAGVDARRLSEKDAPLPGTTHHIVVAPHEFFVLGDGRKWATDEFVSRAVLFSTEQIQTQWFARSLVFLLRAKAVADMNQQTAAILRKGGVKPICVQPGHASTAPQAAPAGERCQPIRMRLHPPTLSARADLADGQGNLPRILSRAALHHRPIGLRRQPLGENPAQCRQGRFGAPQHQAARRILIQPMRWLRQMPPAHLQSGQPIFHRSPAARPAMCRNPRRLVQHQRIIAQQQDPGSDLRRHMAKTVLP
jgi:hypothetical protein